jgi:hypothetical protein
MADEDVTPEVEGHAEPDTGGGEGVEPPDADATPDDDVAEPDDSGEEA